jgi:Sigma-70, region 4
MNQSSAAIRTTGRIERTSESPSWSLSFIRGEIRNRRMSFPAQTPVFTRLHRPDIQWRIVVLYFVRGWSSGSIAMRYGVTRERVRQILRHWFARAREHGYIDVTPAEGEFAWLSSVLSTAWVAV